MPAVGSTTRRCGCATVEHPQLDHHGQLRRDYGGGIAHYGTLNLTNSIVAGNSAGIAGSDLYYRAGTVNYAGRNVFSPAAIGGAGDIVEPNLANIFATSG